MAAKAVTDKPSIIKIRTVIGFGSTKQGTGDLYFLAVTQPPFLPSTPPFIPPFLIALPSSHLLLPLFFSTSSFHPSLLSFIFVHMTTPPLNVSTSPQSDHQAECTVLLSDPLTSHMSREHLTIALTRYRPPSLSLSLFLWLLSLLCLVSLSVTVLVSSLSLTQSFPLSLPLLYFFLFSATFSSLPLSLLCPFLVCLMLYFTILSSHTMDNDNIFLLLPCQLLLLPLLLLLYSPLLSFPAV